MPKCVLLRAGRFFLAVCRAVCVCVSVTHALQCCHHRQSLSITGHKANISVQKMIIGLHNNTSPVISYEHAY